VLRLRGAVVAVPTIRISEMTSRTTNDDALSWGTDMVYELKDQDVTPPSPEPGDMQSVNRDAAGALGIAVLTIALIALIIGVQIL
jgi:hypothetical protein